MSNQETFDKVVTHLRKQGKRAFGTVLKNEDYVSMCMYRSPEGLKCAAGCLIPDEMYDPSFEGERIFYIPLREIFKKGGHDLSLVLELQKIHDGYDVQYWEEQFSSLAQDFRLEYTTP